MTIMNTVVIQPRYSSGFGFFDNDLSTGYLFGRSKDNAGIIYLTSDEMKDLPKVLGIIDELQSKSDIHGHTVQVSSRLQVIWTDHVLVIEELERKASVHFGVGMMSTKEGRRLSISSVIKQLVSVLEMLRDVREGNRLLPSVIELIGEYTRNMPLSHQVTLFDNTDQNPRDPTNITLAQFTPPSVNGDHGVHMTFCNMDGLYQRYFQNVEMLEELRACFLALPELYKNRKDGKGSFTYQKYFETTCSLSGFLATAFPLRTDGTWSGVLSNATVKNVNYYTFFGGPDAIKHHVDVLSNAIGYFKAYNQQFLE